MSTSDALSIGEPPSTSVANAEAVRAAIALVLASPDFDVPDRAKRFLNYVVEEWIAGRGDRIKAYSIATEVFGRDSSFDAQADPVVRIEAGRVRRALAHYYLTAGRNDPIVTTIPKGGYIPQFEERSAATRAALADISREPPDIDIERTVNVGSVPTWALFAFALLLVLAAGPAGVLNASSISGLWSSPTASLTPQMPVMPRILVRPFEDLTKSETSSVVARGLTEEIIGRIAKFRELVVVTAPKDPDARWDSAPYILEGSLRLENDKVRLTARVVSGGSVVWANIYDDDLDVRAILEVQNDIANKVAAAIAQPYGAIFTADLSRVGANAPDDWAAYACTLSYYAYRTNFDPKLAENVQTCLEQAVARFPEYATAWAMLSLVYIDRLRYRNSLSVQLPFSIDKAETAARNAIELDPENVRSLQAQMMVLAFKNDVEAALKIGGRAVAINPNDSELTYEYGTRLAVAGQWVLGAQYIVKAMDRNPAPPAQMEAALALCLYMQRDYAKAATWITRAEVRLNPIYHLIAASIYGQTGDSAAAERERLWLEVNAPQLIGNLPQEFAMRSMKPGDQQHIVEGLRKAGFSIPGF